MFSTSSQMLRIIDEDGQSPCGAWPQTDFIRGHARKRSARSENQSVLNIYTFTKVDVTESV